MKLQPKKWLAGCLLPLCVLNTPAAIAVGVAVPPENEAKRLEDYKDSLARIRSIDFDDDGTHVVPSYRDVATRVFQYYKHRYGFGQDPAISSNYALLGNYEALSLANAIVCGSNIAEHDRALMLKTQSLLYAELQSRGIAQTVHVHQLYGNLVNARSLAANNLWLTQREALEDYGPPPEFASGSERGGHVVWRWSGQANKLTADRIDMQSPSDLLLIIAQPGCHWAREALQKMQLYSPYLLQNTWVALTPEQGIKWHFWKQWQDEFPDMRFGMIDRLSDWPELSETRISPAFYHFRNGQLAKYTLIWEDLLPTMPAPDKQP